MARRRKRIGRKTLTYARVTQALIGAAHATYGQHESSTSDGYLKRRVSNATWQMMDRVLMDLFPKKSALLGTTIREWKVTLEDVTKFQETVAAYAGQRP